MDADGQVMGSHSDADLNSFLYGTVVAVQQHYGFIRPDNRLPFPFKPRKNIHFSARLTHMDDVNLGDRVVFELKKDTENRPDALKVTCFESHIDLSTMEPFYIRPECGHIGVSINGLPTDLCMQVCRKLLECGHYTEGLCFEPCDGMCAECSDILQTACSLFCMPKDEVIISTLKYVGEGHGYINSSSKQQGPNNGVFFTFDETEPKVTAGDRVVYTLKTRMTGRPSADKLGVIRSDSGEGVYIHQIKQVINYSKPTAKQNPVDKFEIQAAEGTSNAMLTYNLYARRQVNNDDPKDINFRIVESHFLRLAQKAGKHYTIESITYYVNPPLVRKFRAKLREFEECYGKGQRSSYVLAFHGTRHDNIDNIVKDNFQLAFCQRSVYGKGIYLSEFPHVSLGFGSSLLLCKVLPGNALDVEHSQQNRTIAAGYNSHRVKADSDGYGWAIVVDNPDQILPCYKINYKANADETTAPNSSQPHSNNNNYCVCM